MQFKLFKIPVSSPEQSEELNTWLRSHRILGVERQFCPDNGGYWTFCVEYMDGAVSQESAPAYRNKKKDPAEGLSEEHQRRFFEFKGIRLKVAKEKDIPPYAVFTDRELIKLVQTTPLNEETAKKIKEVAPSRLNNYAHYFFDKETITEENG